MKYKKITNKLNSINHEAIRLATIRGTTLFTPTVRSLTRSTLLNRVADSFSLMEWRLLRQLDSILWVPYYDAIRENIWDA